MAVKATERGPWRALVQRGWDTAADLFDAVAHKVSAATDPRARLLRRRRRELFQGYLRAISPLYTTPA